MRKVAHPEKLYIQIYDESQNIFGFSFNDQLDEPEGIDPNEFDQETLMRVTQMLANTFVCIERLMNKGQKIKSIESDV